MPADIRRYGPGVPSAEPASAVLTAEEAWRTGQFPQPPAPGRRWRQWAGTALSVVLIIAAGVVIYLRLHHVPLRVTGVTISAQTRSGCALDITGRIGTAGGAGIVSYQWVFAPQQAAPRPLSQSVAAGQSAAFVTATIAGHGHGRLAQRVTLQVLGPGQGSASSHVVISC
jgi:hypothetical protein